MRKITKLRRSVKAISPIISVLLMIAIAVSAALVAYAWVSGYMDFTTTKIGKSIQIQSVSKNPAAVYVQNVGDSDVALKSCYINGNLDIVASASIDGVILQKSRTQSITDFTYGSEFNAKMITIKIVTTNGISAEITNTFATSQTAYSLTLETAGTGGGSLTKTPDQESYNPGDEIQIAATSTPGWTFVGWNGDLTGNENPTTVTITDNLSIIGTFTQDEYSLTTSIDGSGTVSKNPDRTTYLYGDTVEITANPNSGWVFSGWSGGITSTNNPETITMNTPKTIQATFIPLIETTLFSDNFENLDTWDQTSSQWYLSPDQHHSGRYSAKSTDGQEGDFICNQLNTQNSEAITLDLWYRLANGVDGGDFRIYFYDGNNWDQIVDLGSQSEGSWRHYTYTTTDSQYMKSNFRVRFDSDLGGSETVWIDDIVIIKTTSAVFDDGFEGSSSSWDNAWDSTSHHWFRSTTRHSGAYAAGSDYNDEGYFYSDPRDTRNSIAVIVDFWYRLDDTENNDFRLDFYDGNNYDTITSNLGSGSQDTWRHYTYTTTDSQYMKSNFRIRFYTSLDNGENVWIDDVKIIAIKTSDSIISEDFETWEDNWDATSTNWLLSSDQHHGGIYSAKSTDGQEGDFICDSIDTTTAVSITVDFWYRLDDTEDNDLMLYFYDGSHWDSIMVLGGGNEDTWQHYSYTTTDDQYMKSNFRIRFNTSLNNGENVWIDDVTITMSSLP